VLPCGPIGFCVTGEAETNQSINGIAHMLLDIGYGRLRQKAHWRLIHAGQPRLMMLQKCLEWGVHQGIPQFQA
jgi:hypothetical protein